MWLSCNKTVFAVSSNFQSRNTEGGEIAGGGGGGGVGGEGIYSLKKKIYWKKMVE
jgi:hypothetical protein